MCNVYECVYVYVYVFEYAYVFVYVYVYVGVYLYAGWCTGKTAIFLNILRCVTQNSLTISAVTAQHPDPYSAVDVTTDSNSFRRKEN